MANCSLSRVQRKQSRYGNSPLIQPSRALRATLRASIALHSPRTGQLLASGSSDRTVRVWSLNDSPPEVFLQAEKWRVRVSAVAFSPDGTKLAVGLDPIMPEFYEELEMPEALVAIW